MKRARILTATTIGVAVVLAAGSSADACGGLVGENGTIELVRTTTLAAYSDGIERYVTAFEFTGEGEEVGAIVPLPDVPTAVERGGDWTLQRLAQEVAPPVLPAAAESAADAVGQSAGVEVILEAEIDALDITVLRGGGDAVGEWAVEHGFFLTPDAPEVLDFYAQRSPVFMAARFDATRAAELGQSAGDSTPIMATIPTDDPWVPVRILGLGAEGEQRIEADVFLLTDERPELLAGGTGMTLRRSEAADELLLDDLRSDVGMEWVPEAMWLSFLQVDAPAAELDYDLAVSTTPGVDPDLVDTGVPSPEVRGLTFGGGGSDTVPLTAGVGAATLTAAVAAWWAARSRRTEPLNGNG